MTDSPTGTRVLSGLSDADVRERHRTGRGNDVSAPTSRSVADILRENVLTLFNGILAVCFVAVVLLGDFRDGFFFIIVVANALIGIVQEVRAKVVLDRAALLAAPHARVRRESRVLTVDLADVVLDDVLVLRPGDQVPADARVLESTGLGLDESMLTGESDPAFKDEGETLLSGSHVVAGSGYACVTAVGADSYASKLTAQIKQHSLVPSELREATNRILVYLSWILGPVILITLIGRVFAYGGLHQIFVGNRWHEALIDAVASVVGMIPEGLVLLISLAFGVAAIQLAARKVLVQELAAVEVLARVDVLCLDKTGTLTKGELAFDRVVVLDAEGSQTSRLALDEPELESLADRAVPDDVARALGVFGSDDAANATAGILSAHFSAGDVRVLSRVPFSSSTRFSGVRFLVPGNGGAGGDASGSDGGSDHDDQSWILGAPERVLAGHPAELARAQRLAASGLRTLALARVAGVLEQHESARREPRALVVFREDLREEARDTLAFFAQQDVRVVVMSGDNPVTVGAVAGALGLPGPAMDASALTDDAQLAQALGAAQVFGRVSPEQKRTAVRLLQQQGRVVGMTGDGVNDAMAIKDADLGISMGTGTSATKAVSRLVLLDNRFDRMPTVLALGRRVIANVERVANIFLTKTAYGILLALVSAAIAWPFPFLPRQLSLVSGLAIGLPSFVLALAPNARRYTPGVLGRVIRFSIPTGVIATATCVGAYLPLYRALPLAEARSVTTVALFCVSLWIVCVLTRPLSAPRVGLIVGVAALFVAVCVVPLGADFFAMHLHLGWPLIYGVGVGALGAGAVEVFYRFAKRRRLVFDRQ